MNYIIKSNLDNDNLRRKKNSGMHNNIFLKFRYEISIPNGNWSYPSLFCTWMGQNKKIGAKSLKKKLSLWSRVLRMLIHCITETFVNNFSCHCCTEVANVLWTSINRDVVIFTWVAWRFAWCFTWCIIISDSAWNLRDFISWNNVKIFTRIK